LRRMNWIDRCRPVAMLLPVMEPCEPGEPPAPGMGPAGNLGLRSLRADKREFAKDPARRIPEFLVLAPIARTIPIFRKIVVRGPFHAQDMERIQISSRN